jgi:tripeptidyl-peptidase-1
VFSPRPAYPDVVLFGHDYPVINNGKVVQVDGTSASSPSLAGMFTLIADLRAKAGQAPLGQ